MHKSDEWKTNNIVCGQVNNVPVFRVNDMNQGEWPTTRSQSTVRYLNAGDQLVLDLPGNGVTPNCYNGYDPTFCTFSGFYIGPPNWRATDVLVSALLFLVETFFERFKRWIKCICDIMIGHFWVKISLSAYQVYRLILNYSVKLCNFKSWIKGERVWPIHRRCFVYKHMDWLYQACQVFNFSWIENIFCSGTTVCHYCVRKLVIVQTFFTIICN